MIDKYRRPIIIGIVVLAVAFLISALTNSTFALFSRDVYGTNNNVYSTGMLAIDVKSKSENISLDNTVPMSDEDGLLTNPYVFTIKNIGNLDYLFDIKLLSTGSSDTTFSSQYIKLQIDDGEVTTLSALTNGEIKSDVTLRVGESIDVSIRIWLSIDTPNTELGKSFNSKIVTDGQAIYTESNYEYSISLINYIRHLYTKANPTQITHNKDDGTSDKYYYSYQDTSNTWGLMNDGLKVSDTLGEGATEITNTSKLITGSEGNIRYFGPSDSVNNYIYFNCDTYPSTNCERWRIIGIVDGKVKIIRDQSIGNLAWDQDKNQDSSLTTYSNNWQTSSLQLFLNGLYYNRGNTETHTYYSESDGSVSSELNLVDIGIKNDSTRRIISESLWYLGGYNTTRVYSNEIYTYERTNTIGTSIYNGNPFTIVANVGLMYPSDYGYGTNLTKCYDTLYTYDNSANSYVCRDNNWIYNSSISQWVITPPSSFDHSVMMVYKSGNVNGGTVSSKIFSVRPVLYLDTSVLKVGGDGSYDNPYLVGSASEQKYYLMEVTEAQTETSNFLRSTIKRNEISSVTFVDNNIVPEGYTGVDVSVNNDGTVMMWYGAKNASNLYDIYIGSESGKVSLSSGAYLFQLLTNCTSINFNNILDTSNVTSFYRMFDRCSSLTTLDVSSFNTSNVTNMERVFQVCINLETLDLSSWDTSKVTTMYSMFAQCSSLTNLNLSNFNTSSVTTMEFMFLNCTNLTSLDLSNFNTSNVTDMSYMFQNCTKLTDLDLSNWDVSSVTTMVGMFLATKTNIMSLTTIGDVSNWDTSNVTDMSYMFQNCTKLTELDLSKWDVSKVTTMHGMFMSTESCGMSLTTIGDVSNWDTSHVTNMRAMFQLCSSLTEIDVSGWNTLNVTDMSYMFYNCSSLTSLDVSGFDTSSVTTMEAMFCNCSSLTELDVSKWNTLKVKNISYMFEGCSGLTELDVSKWNTSKVTNISYMFEGCSGLTELNISGWNISNVTAMQAVFRDCVNLKKLDIENWNTGKVSAMYAVFSGCQSLESLDLSAWNVRNVGSMWAMFNKCYSLTDLDLSGWDTSKFTETREMFYNCNKLKTIYVSDKWNMGSVTNSTNMFTGCTSLVGGNGTTYNASYIDVAYARVDTAGNPGYFTLKSV